jgi:hypothetical protein
MGDYTSVDATVLAYTYQCEQPSAFSDRTDSPGTDFRLACTATIPPYTSVTPAPSPSPLPSAFMICTFACRSLRVGTRRLLRPRRARTTTPASTRGGGWVCAWAQGPGWPPGSPSIFSFSFSPTHPTQLGGSTPHSPRDPSRSALGSHCLPPLTGHCLPPLTTCLPMHHHARHHAVTQNRRTPKWTPACSPSGRACPAAGAESPKRAKYPLSSMAFTCGRRSPGEDLRVARPAALGFSAGFAGCLRILLARLRLLRRVRRRSGRGRAPALRCHVCG